MEVREEIIITAEAVTALKKKSANIRIGIKGGSCAGYSYVIRADTNAKENDIIFLFGEELTVRIDPKSFSFLKGTVIDYKTSLFQRQFVFHNPRAKSHCGCGESFSIK